MHRYKYNIDDNTENASYKCYEKDYLLCGYGSIPARAKFFSPIQLIEDLIRNRCSHKMKKNRVFVVLTTTRYRVSLINCVQIYNNNDSYLTCVNSEKKSLCVSAVRGITFSHKISGGGVIIGIKSSLDTSRTV